VTTDEARQLLAAYKEGRVELDSVIHQLQAPTSVNLGFANVDTDRAFRKGFPEVIFGGSKTPDQIQAIALEILKRENSLLVTRVNEEVGQRLSKVIPNGEYFPLARAFAVRAVLPSNLAHPIAVLCAGTSDLPVAEEAAITAETMGNCVHRINDIGVAGLHRLLGKLDIIRSASVIIVVAGMEGALPSVVAGLVSQPVIAVPTSIGYGASFGGIAALLGMLNSCGSGVTVVNIDNGFGAGYAASQITALLRRN
jgi:NCAIR mutase (PurE)-related protein